MTATLQTLIANSRSLLDETTGNFYTDPELTTWINDGLRDVARRTEDLENINTTTPVIIGTANYALPADCIRIHRVEFQPAGSTQLYPIEIRNRNEIDGLIGFNPTIQSSYPWVCWLWGTPGNSTFPLTISFYPVFSTGGQLNIWYFHMPAILIQPTDVAEIPSGWEDLIPLFVEAMGKRKDRDPSWQEAKAEYENRLVSMIEVSRAWHDQTNQIMNPRSSSWSMQWLWGFDE
jgi:hypothetical protein